MKSNIYILIIAFLFGNINFLQSKDFVFYDAIAYSGKPDLSAEGLTPIHLIYEAKLTSPSVLNPDKAVLDLDKIDNQAEMYANFPDVVVSTDIEQWLWDTTIDGDSMSNLYKTLFERFRAKNKNVIIGNYGIAPGNLSVYRYNLPNLDNNTIIERWKRDNLKRWESVKYADIVFPTIYIPEPNIVSWINDLKTTVNEIKKYAPTKKIVAYIWPQYYDKQGSPYNLQFISPAIWEQMLQAVYENCDGAIIWSSRTDDSGSIINWSDSRVQNLWEKTKEFIASRHINMPENDFVIQENHPEKSFKIFSSINYYGTPTSFQNEGIHNCLMFTDMELSNGIRDANGIYQPDSNKVTTLANRTLSASEPIFLSGTTWIRDRNTNNESMLNRFARIKRIFRHRNSTSSISFMNSSSPSLNSLHVDFNNSNFSLVASEWMESFVKPTRSLSSFSDFILPANFAINDDTITWKRSFYLSVKEARLSNPSKQIYAHFYTDYYNNTSNFGKANMPISYSTWEVMLESALKMCDGVVISSFGNSSWSESLPFWIATKDFINSNQDKIVFPNSTGLQTKFEKEHRPFQINNYEIILTRSFNTIYLYDFLGRKLVQKQNTLAGEKITLPNRKGNYIISLDTKNYKIAIY